MTCGSNKGVLGLHLSDLDRLSALSVEDLERLLRHVRQQLGVERLHQMTNENTVSVRLPLEVCDRVKELALRFGTTRSRVVPGGP